MAGSGTYFKFNVPPGPAGGGGGRRGARRAQGGEGRDVRRMSRRRGNVPMRGGEISTGAILRVEMRLAELGGAIFLKNARRDVNSRCSFSRFSAINLAASRGRETAKYPAIKSLDAAS